MTAIAPFSQQFPRDGTLLIGGVHLKTEMWLKYTRFRRVIVFYNLSQQGQLFSIVEGVRELTGLDPEIVAVSRLLQRSAGLPGRVIPSTLDTGPFVKVAHSRFAGWDGRTASGPLTVGRASRDLLDKHHPQDLSLYRMLASSGLQVRIMGGTCLAPGLGNAKGIELLPAGAESMADFYASLDIMFYRTGEFMEAYGRVVLEAMAAGLPVVAHANGGYAERIVDKVSGFLIRSQEEAYDAIMSLCDSAPLRRKIGEAALRQALSVHGPQAVERDIAYYLD